MYEGSEFCTKNTLSALIGRVISIYVHCALSPHSVTLKKTFYYIQFYVHS